MVEAELSRGAKKKSRNPNGGVDAFVGSLRLGVCEGEIL